MPRKRYRIFTRTLSSSAALLALAFVLSATGQAGAAVHNLGRSGSVYGISEPDALKEIEDRARSIKIDREAFRKEMEEKVALYRPFNSVSLPPAANDRIRLVDMTYTLKFDIPDGKGGILYPKGFIFNPLEYVPFSQTLVVLNGSREEEIEWFLASGYSKRRNVKVLLTGGDWRSVLRKIKRPVFYLTAPVAERFRLKATPSVVTVKGNRYMEVKEIHVRPEDSAPRDAKR